MQVNPLAFLGDQAIGVSMGLIIQKAIGFDEPAVKKLRAVRVSGGEFHPAFVKISLFGHKIVADFFILYDESHGHGFTGQYCVVLPVQRRNELFLARVCFGQSKDIQAQSVFEVSLGHLHLFIVVIEKRDGGIGAGPAMRCDLMVLGAIVSWGIHFIHVAGLAVGVHVFLVKRQR